ncbi:MAG: helix-turn-helix domain-containing protein [Alphaproteobacteria bacterium]|nr:helix-turn-helix domain-containing protein [Alphaproteobacteria bacterium]
MISARTTYHPIDAYVGKRLRIRRKMMSMSQTKLGDAVGLTFQQIQKYERGANRIGASRLFEFSQILDVPISYFYDEMPDDIKESSGAKQSHDENVELAILDPMLEPDSVALVRAYGRVESAPVRKSLFNLAKVLGRASRKRGT